MDQNSALKKEAGIAERKLLARNERIQNLETLLQDADRRLAAQNQKFEEQLQSVKDRLDQARGARTPDFPNVLSFVLTLTHSAAQKAATTSTPIGFGRIAKPLRGGGGAHLASASSPPTGFAGTGSSGNPLARVQNEDAG